MKHMLHISRFGATYETCLPTRLAEDRCCSKESML
jgi:hypothetical protein